MAATHLALELADHEIRAAVATVTKTGGTARDLFVVALPDAPAESAPAALRQALRSRRLRPTRVTLVLPKAQVTTRRVTLPSADPDEIARMAQFEAERHIPFHPERHIVSHHIVKTDALAGSQVFLAAVDGPVVAQALQLLHAADVVPDAITVSSAASHSALLIAEGPGLAGRVTALVVIGPETTDISIIGQGELLFTRSVAVGAKALLAREGGDPLGREALGQMRVGADHPDGRAAVIAAFLDRLGGELRRTWEFARREYECPALEEVLVAGEGSLVQGLAEALGERLALPGRRVDLSRLAGRCDPQAGGLDQVAAHFTTVGAVLTPPPEGAVVIDLTPPEQRARRQAQRMRQVILVTGALGLITVVLTLVYLRVALSAVRESVDRYRDVVNAMRPAIEEMEDKRTQIQIIQNFVDERNSALAILDFLSGLPYVPPRNHTGNTPSVRVAINEFVYDRSDGTLKISGLARDIEDVSTLRTDLENTGFFSSARITERPPLPLSDGRPTVIEFTIECQLLQTEVAHPEEEEEGTPASRRPAEEIWVGGERL